MNQNKINVMAKDAIPPSPSTQPTTKKEPPVDPWLQRWVEFQELARKAIDRVKDNNHMDQFIKNDDENRKARAEKRMMAKLRRMEVEQKAVLLAEAQKNLKEARHNFQSPEDYTPNSPSLIEDLRAWEELRALEREQKEELYNEVMEKRAKEAGDDWPRIQQLSQDPRFDHIPKPRPGDQNIIAKAFPWTSPIKAKESDE